MAVEKAFQNFKYMFAYKTLVDDLNSQIERLDNEKTRMDRKVREARDTGKIIYADVLAWQVHAEELMKICVYQGSPSLRCIPCLPIPNPISRFRIGRKTVRKAKMVTQAIASGEELYDNEIAFILPSENVQDSGTASAYVSPFENVQDSGTVSAFINFHSRKNAYKKLWEMLTTKGSPQILGIHGMAGVGKTQMMQQIGKEAINKRIFNKVIPVYVGSEKLDVIKIQNHMAGHLHFSFESEDNVKKRAVMLKNSLMNDGKILVMFDDVWEEIPLDVIGISFSSIDSKILLTSRGENACVLNNCKNPVNITPLTDNEALDLFTNVVGTYQIESLEDKSLVTEICKHCGGLPLVIHAVGKALQFRSHDGWKDALGQFEYGEVEYIEGIVPDAYADVKLSIDRLPDDAKSCLFLSSMFPEDAAINTRKLISLAMGTQLVPEEGFNIRHVIDTLGFSSLILLDYQKDHMIKLHDLVRDIAISIASRDPKYAFLLVRCGLWWPHNDNYGTRKLLHIHLEEENFRFPHDLEFPDLHTLWLQCNKHIQQFSGSFFSMFVNLRFLFIQGGMFSSLDQQISLQPLSKIRILILDNCDISSIHQSKLSFFPKNLETLCIWDCYLSVPLDLPNQNNLRRLEIIGKIGEVVFRPNTISRLYSLEVLHVPNGFQILVDGSALTVPIFAEISELTHLKSLQTFLSVSEHFKDAKVFCNLLEFKIVVGQPSEYFGDFNRLIILHGDQLEGLGSLMERAEEMVLQSTTDVNMSKIWNTNREAFADLRNLYIEKCNTMMHLASSVARVEIHRGQPRASFSKLIILEIRNCALIEYLFCNSVAKCLEQLQELCIDNCPVMKVIVMDEGKGDGKIINFSKLKSLKLVGLPRLTSFYRDKSDQIQPLFHRMVAFPSLENLHIEYLEDISNIWAKHKYDDEVSFCKLTSLKVSECDKLQLVIPLAMLPRLQKLEHLSIACCSSVVSEVGTFGANTVLCPLVALHSMDLESLPCLTETKLNSREYPDAKTWYPNLENLRICDCNGLRNVFLPCTAKNLMHFKKLRVVGCNNMTEIIREGTDEITDGILLHEMTDLKLTRLPKLTSIWCHKVKFPSLKYVEPLDCGKLVWTR